MSRTLAIIPARAGSKGVPGKNVRPLAGVPLVGWAIRVAQLARSVTHVVVSTDGDAIADASRAEGAEVIRRPADLAADEAPTMPVIGHALDVLEGRGEKFDTVVLLEPTSPFRSAAVVDRAVTMLGEGDCAAVVTVTQVERNPYNIFQVDGDRAERFIREPSGTFFQRQTMDHLKRVNGCLYATSVAGVRRGKLVDFPLRVIEMSHEESVNIDSHIDFAVAEILAPKFRSRIDR